jgi:hypothetical protein
LFVIASEERDMPKNSAEETGDGGTAVILTGDATALGGDTLSYVSADLSVTVKTNGNSGKSMVKGDGDITAIAVAEAAEAAESDSSITTAFTTAFASDADKVKIKTTEATFEEDGVSYSYSYTTIKVWDSDKDKEPTLSHKIKTKELSEVSVELDGNLALTDFDITAEGPETLAVVESDALALENQLSESRLSATAAVDYPL